MPTLETLKSDVRINFLIIHNCLNKLCYFSDNIEYVGNPMAKLEDALVLCKFGRFHWKLMVATLFSVLATTAVTTTSSYILPSAECDLALTVMQKGILNAIPFLGELRETIRIPVAVCGFKFKIKFLNVVAIPVSNSEGSQKSDPH